MKRYYTVVITLLLVISAGSAVMLGGSAPVDDRGTDVQERNQEYEVTFSNVTIKSWRLINVTVTNVTVERLSVENASSEGEMVENKTFKNISLTEIVIEGAILRNVTADRLVVRNRSIIDVPGGDIMPPKIDGRTIEEHVLKDITVDGVVVENLTVSTANFNETVASPVNLSDGELVSQPAGEADVSVTSASVERGNINNATLGGWRVEDEVNETGDEGDASTDSRYSGSRADGTSRY